ncbi:tripartite tricarboxylate transporter substrate binding protein [Paracidovorax valerianellae]|uniref:Tripartite-type tricarboxylate transporter, receptor component TctC n=1 Tax=Paracidovorax valerianellae TaxID=187868 RepID=A0A1G6WMX5_9BURK|nr:tripartite tricarboxylate transporter substrate binding protein [Paracidovorax valerianellae]MDA8447587.1 tripartite tricarboxylate transporter substrate binding protein [Paracidovorax valerianellae]SDD66567.1 Tripartite-type tricarboxylate transporter, receptor component TctC [Paracidovorax valerianellae]
MPSLPTTRALPAHTLSLTRRGALALGAAVLAAPGLVRAQPGDKPLRVILPLSAGSGADGAIRAMSNSLSKALGHPVVIENLPGAGGITGTTQLVRAAKDGSVIGVVSNNHVVNPSVYKNIPFDSLQDITPITVIGATPFVLVAHPSVEAKNVKELIALAKAKPGTLNYGSSGNGTILHLGAAMFVDQAKLDIKHIPYRGMGPLMNDILGGHVQLGVVAVAPAAPHIKSGALRAIGVTTATRVKALPGVPTLAEQGLPAYELEGWVAAVGPAGLPKAEVDRLYQGFKAALDMPEARDALIAQGYEIKLTPPDASAAFFRSELARMAQVVKNANVSMD